MLQGVSSPILTARAKASEISQRTRDLVKTCEQIDNGPLDLVSDSVGLIEMREGTEQLNASFRRDSSVPHCDLTVKQKSDGHKTISSVTVNDSDVQGLELKREGNSISGHRFFTDESGFILSEPLKEHKAQLYWVTSCGDLNTF